MIHVIAVITAKPGQREKGEDVNARLHATPWTAGTPPPRARAE